MLGLVILESAIPVGKNKINLIERWYWQTIIANILVNTDLLMKFNYGFQAWLLFYVDREWEWQWPSVNTKCGFVIFEFDHFALIWSTRVKFV